MTLATRELALFRLPQPTNKLPSASSVNKQADERPKDVARKGAQGLGVGAISCMAQAVEDWNDMIPSLYRLGVRLQGIANAPKSTPFCPESA